MTDDRSLAEYLGIGAGAAGVIILGGGLGFVADEGLGTLPIFVFVGLVLGIVGAVTIVWRRFGDSLRGPGNR